MLDGAPSIGELENVTWLTPSEIFEIKLRKQIAELLRWDIRREKVEENLLNTIAA